MQTHRKPRWHKWKCGFAPPAKRTPVRNEANAARVIGWLRGRGFGYRDDATGSARKSITTVPTSPSRSTGRIAQTLPSFEAP